MYKYIIDHIPKTTSNNRRPNIKLDFQTITIHNTGNAKSTARNERTWLTNPSNTRTASYHLVVDEKEVIEVIPLDEVAYHAGTATGNKTSLGIEICESGDYQQALKNAVILVANLLESKNKSTTDLKQHYDWSGKNCPWKIRAGHMGWTWDKFKGEVDKELTKGKVIVTMSKYFKDISKKWQSEHIDSLYDKGIIQGKREGIFEPDSNTTRAEVCTIIDRTIDYILNELRNK